MRRSLTLAFGILLGSWLPALGQTTATPVKPAKRNLSAPRRPAAPAQFPSVVSLLVHPLDPLSTPTAGLLAATYGRDLASGNFLSLQVVKNPTIRQVHLGFAQFWSGRLQLGGFGSTRRMDNALRFGPGWGGFPGFRGATSDYPNLRVLGAERTYGFTMTFRLDRDARTGRRAEACRCFGWMTGLFR